MTGNARYGNPAGEPGATPTCIACRKPKGTGSLLDFQPTVPGHLPLLSIEQWREFAARFRCPVCADDRLAGAVTWKPRPGDASLPAPKVVAHAEHVPSINVVVGHGQFIGYRPVCSCGWGGKDPLGKDPAREAAIRHTREARS